MTNVVLFGGQNLRLHDNLCVLSSPSEEPITAALLLPPGRENDFAAAVECLEKSIKDCGGKLFKVDPGDMTTSLRLLYPDSVDDSKSTSTNTLVYTTSFIRSAGARITRKFVDEATKLGIDTRGISDELAHFDIALSHFASTRPQFEAYEGYYDDENAVPKPSMQTKMKFAAVVPSPSSGQPSPETAGSSDSTILPPSSRQLNINGLMGEDLALFLVKEYLDLGDKAFSLKYVHTNMINIPVPCILHANSLLVLHVFLYLRISFSLFTKIIFSGTQSIIRKYLRPREVMLDH
jgi:hypothetical protein